MKMIFAIILFYLLTSCGNTHILSSWKADGASTDRYKKILVLGIAGSKDATLREEMEITLSKTLQEKCPSVVSAWQFYGPTYFEQMSEQDATAKVKQDGFEAVMEIVLLDKGKEKNYIPGRVLYSIYAVAHSQWYQGYRVFYDHIYQPGYFTPATSYTLETNFYSTKTDILEYAAAAKSYDSSASKTAQAVEFGKAVVQDMVKQGILTK
jgi:hypothetical protein